MKKKQIAILMATYNGGKYIREQIDSVIQQTCDDWHLYIRDDGSTDDTIQIVKDYCHKYDNISLVEDNLGRLGCRDQFLHLLDIVDSDYYMFCDQDDVWFHDKIEKSIIKIQELEHNNPNQAILVGSDSTICGSELEIINKSCWDFLRIDPAKFLTYQGICVYPFITGASMIFNSKVKSLLPPIPNNLPKNRPMYDWWLLINAFKYGIVDLLNEPTRFYRQHVNNVSGGIDKLDTSYFDKFNKLHQVFNANQIRGKVLKQIGYGSIIKYYYYKVIYLIKKISYKKNNIV